MKGMLRFKRIYDEPSEEDGFRILVDRLWPRGMKKEKAQIDAWLKDIAPSDEIRKKYHQDGDYEYFQRRYKQELDQNENTAALISIVKEKLKGENVTLLTASKKVNACNVSVLYEYLIQNI